MDVAFKCVYIGGSILGFSFASARAFEWVDGLRRERERGEYKNVDFSVLSLGARKWEQNNGLDSESAVGSQMIRLIL